MYSEGVLFLELIKAMEYILAIDFRYMNRAVISICYIGTRKSVYILNMVITLFCLCQVILKKEDLIL